MSNIFQRLRAAFTVRPAGQPPIPVGQFPVYPQANMETFVRAYSENSTVYTIVNQMARKFAFIPRYLYEVDDPGMQAKYQMQIKMRNPNLRAYKMEKLLKKAYQDDVVEDSPLSQLLAQPNPYQAQDSFYQQIYTYKKLTGNSFVWLNRGDNDNVEGDARLSLPVLEMYVLPSQLVTIQVDRSYLFGMITGYTFYDSGSPIYLAKEDVIHWKDANPAYDSYNFQHFYGTSPLAPGLKLLTQDQAQRDAATAMYQNGGARGVLANETMNELTQVQVAAMDSAIDTKINNRDMRSAVAALPGKWTYLYMGQSAVDMDLIESQDKTFQRIANLLGANPQLWETQTTFNNVEQARKDLITNAICPDACSYRDEENRILLQAFGLSQSQYCIDIDVTDLPELQDDMEKLTARIMSNYTITGNEKRQELGFDPLPMPEMDIIFIPNNLVPIEDAAVLTAQLGADAMQQSLDNPDGAGGGDSVSNPSKGHSGAGDKENLPSRQVDAAWSKAVVHP